MKRRKRAVDRRRYPRHNHGGRDVNNVFYERFRDEVRIRDGHKCKWPGCGSNRRLQVHHIHKWAEFPNLRYNIANGITLCNFHHRLIKNCEEYYVGFFQRILELQMLEKINELSYNNSARGSL
jgi:hypothetical protein